MEEVSKSEIVNGRLSIARVDTVDLAEKYGTPLYVVNADRIRYKYRTLRSTLEAAYPHAKICYSYKANANLAICNLLKSEGAGAAVASLGGLRTAATVGVDAGAVVFDGPSKSDEELRAAVRMGIGAINAESVEELRVLDEIASSLGRTVVAGIRINVALAARTHTKLATSRRGDKFGVSESEAFKAFKLASKFASVRLEGVHSHIGSQILDPKYFEEQARRVMAFAGKLRRSLGFSIRFVNLGGGFGLPYQRGSKPFPLRECATSIAEIVRSECHARGLDLPMVVFEPGRFIVGDSTILLTRVNYVKKVGAINWALVDAGMNDFIRPALYDAYHEMVVANKASVTASKSYSVGGPICESSDVIAVNRRLPPLERGDILAIEDVGAYGICMASEYMSRPIPAMVMVEAEGSKIIRRRGTTEELFSRDLVD